MKKNISKEEYNKIYAALKFIEYLYIQGKIKKHIYKNIINDYSNVIDVSSFKCYNNT